MAIDTSLSETDSPDALLILDQLREKDQLFDWKRVFQDAQKITHQPAEKTSAYEVRTVEQVDRKGYLKKQTTRVGLGLLVVICAAVIRIVFLDSLAESPVREGSEGMLAIITFITGLMVSLGLGALSLLLVWAGMMYMLYGIGDQHTVQVSVADKEVEFSKPLLSVKVHVPSPIVYHTHVTTDQEDVYAVITREYPKSKDGSMHMQSEEVRILLDDASPKRTVDALDRLLEEVQDLEQAAADSYHEQLELYGFGEEQRYEVETTLRLRVKQAHKHILQQHDTSESQHGMIESLNKLVQQREITEST